MVRQFQALQNAIIEYLNQMVLKNQDAMRRNLSTKTLSSNFLGHFCEYHTIFKTWRTGQTP